MSTLQAIPTQHGIDILNSELKNTVTKYRLIGALTHDAPSESLTSFYENTIETSYYDDNGVLTFILNLPIEQHFDEYLHQIHVLDSSNQSVIECSTPKVALPKGIGGMVTLKAAISGEAGQVIFKHGEFVTETELLDLHLSQYLKTEILIGLVIPDSTMLPTRKLAFAADGSAYQVIHYPKLMSKVQGTAIMVAQSLIDVNPEQYAACYGISDDGLTFTVPNYSLRPHLAVAGSFGAVGSTVEDQIQNITGRISNKARTEGVNFSAPSQSNAEGALKFEDEMTSTVGGNLQNAASNAISFDASRSVRTGSYTEVNSSFLNFYIIHGEVA